MRLSLLLLSALAMLPLSSGPAVASSPAAAARVAETRLPHISIVKRGSGSPIVLIPGLATPRDVWSKAVGDLAKDHAVYLVQVNGFGGDDAGANAAEGLLPGIVTDLHDYLQQEKAGPALIVGHSMGGLLAMQLALAHPGDVARVMVVDSLPFAGAMFDENATPDALRPMVPMLKARLASGYSGEAGEAAAEMTAKGLTAKASSAAAVKAWIKRANPKVAAEAMAEAVTTDLRADLKSLRSPLTVLHPASAGSKDAEATSAFYRRQYAAARSVEFVAIPDSGHFIMLDQPELFAEKLRAFAH